MPTTHYFHVCFWGLICHINHKTRPGVKVHAALVNTDGTHQPLLSLQSGKAYPIDGNVTYASPHDEGLAVAHTNHFREWVPSLREIIRGKLKKGVYEKTNTDVALYVDYPRGDDDVQLTVVNLYRKLAIHRSKSTGNSKAPRRVARLIMARVPTNLPQIEVRVGSHRPILVNSDECILISNVEKSPGGSHKNHFEYFTNLLDDADVAEALAGYDDAGSQSVPAVCSWIIKHIERGKPRGGVKPECGNTTFP